MSKKVVCLIGNGFDLALGLRTSYTDFRNFIELKHGSKMSENLIYKALEEHTGGNWSDLEKKLGEIFKKSTWEGIFKNSDSVLDGEELQFSINEARENLIDDLIEHLKQEEKILGKIQIDDEVKNNMIEGIQRLFSPTIERDQDILKNHQSLYGEDIYFYTISFNYTDSFSYLFNKIESSDYSIGRSFSRYATLYPHGTSEIGTTIGVNDETQLLGYKEGESVLEADTAKFMIKPRNKEHGQDNQYEDALQRISIADIIIIYGMSCGETDKDWWEAIEKRLLGYKNSIAIVFSYETLRRTHNSQVERVRNRVRSKLCSSSENMATIGNRIIVECSKDLFSHIKSKTEEVRKQVDEVQVTKEEDTI
ncbi:AbiH family protein [Abiotrophia defectiva]|jgi:hypothetical protein|uniref:AbiH family protein n=1 Tax=Abiotrophia defectiva TaxID=46125 RepID=UPI0030CFA615